MGRLNFLKSDERKDIQTMLARNSLKSKVKASDFIGFMKRIDTYDGIVSIPNDAKGQLSASVFGNTRINIIPLFTSSKWTINGYTTINSPTKITLDTTVSYQSNYIYIDVEPNQQYVLSGLTNGVAWIYNDLTGTNLLGTVNSTSKSAIITPTVSKIRLNLTNANAGTYTFENFMLEKGNVLYNFITGTKSTFPARVKSVGKNLFNGKYKKDIGINTVDGTFASSVGAKTTEAIKCKSGSQYTISGGNRTIWRFEDVNGNLISTINVQTATVPTGAVKMYVYYAKDLVDDNKIMINEGSLPATYESYVSTESYMSTPDGQPLRSVGNVKDEFTDSQLIRRTDEKILQANDITISEGTNITWARVPKPTDYKDYNTYNGVHVTNNISLGSYVLSSYADDVSKVGTINSNYSQTGFFIGFAKGTTLVQMQTALVNQQLIYQLANPIITPIDIIGNLKAYAGGQIEFSPCLHGFINFNFGENKKIITDSKAPIGSIRKVIRFDIQDDGSIKEIDVTADASAGDSNTSITIANADPKKTYFYDCDIPPEYSTQPQKIIDYEVEKGVATKNFGATAAAWTLDSNEVKARMLVCTNAGGATSIIAPAVEGKEYVIRNTSGQTITIKTSSSTGVTVTNGKTATVIFYGNDYIKTNEI